MNSEESFGPIPKLADALAASGSAAACFQQGGPWAIFTRQRVARQRGTAAPPALPMMEAPGFWQRIWLRLRAIFPTPAEAPPPAAPAQKPGNLAVLLDEAHRWLAARNIEAIAPCLRSQPGAAPPPAAMVSDIGVFWAVVAWRFLAARDTGGQMMTATAADAKTPLVAAWRPERFADRLAMHICIERLIVALAPPGDGACSARAPGGLRRPEVLRAAAALAADAKGPWIELRPLMVGSPLTALIYGDLLAPDYTEAPVARRALQFDYDLSLIWINDISDLPQEGHRLVVIAKHRATSTLHFRIFDTLGMHDRPESDFREKHTELEKLRQAEFWGEPTPSHSGRVRLDMLPFESRRSIVDSVLLITAHTDPDLHWHAQWLTLLARSMTGMILSPPAAEEAFAAAEAAVAAHRAIEPAQIEYVPWWLRWLRDPRAAHTAWSAALATALASVTAIRGQRREQCVKRLRFLSEFLAVANADLGVPEAGGFPAPDRARLGAGYFVARTWDMIVRTLMARRTGGILDVWPGIAARRLSPERARDTLVIGDVENGGAPSQLAREILSELTQLPFAEIGGVTGAEWTREARERLFDVLLIAHPESMDDAEDLRPGTTFAALARAAGVSDEAMSHACERLAGSKDECRVRLPVPPPDQLDRAPAEYLGPWGGFLNSITPPPAVAEVTSTDETYYEDE